MFRDTHTPHGLLLSIISQLAPHFSLMTAPFAENDARLCRSAAFQSGAVHGFAGIIGGMFEKAPHGAVCAALLGPVFRANVRALAAEVRNR